MLVYLRKLNKILTSKDRQFILVLLILSFFLALIETIGISSIMPFISIVSNINSIQNNKYCSMLYMFFKFKSNLDFAIWLGFILIGLQLFRAAYNIAYIYLTNSFTYRKSRIFTRELFYQYMSMPYLEFTRRNSAAMTKAVITDTTFAAMLSSYVVSLLGEIFTILFLYFLLLYVNWRITLLLSLILILKMLFFSKVVSRLTRELGNRSNEYNVKLFKIVSESFRNFKIIKLTSSEERLASDINIISNTISKANIMNQTLSAIPRYVIESVGFSLLMAVILFFLYKNHEALSVLPVISIYALALYRMLPSFNRILLSYNQILFTSKSFDIIHDGLTYSPEIELGEKINFNKNIQIEAVTFSYDGDKGVINNLSLEIKKGSKIGFRGESGIGKSTLIDLIMGVCKPQEGRILIDGIALSLSNIRDWRRRIGYLPQSIYLFDSTVADNIAFGREYNKDKIIDVLKRAKIFDFLQQRNGIETLVGDAGIKLSEGQKQRIGLARALYADPELIVLDEATSSLDIDTENEVLDEIYSIAKDKTLLVTAHRLNTIKRCDIVYEMTNNIIVKVN